MGAARFGGGRKGDVVLAEGLRATGEAEGVGDGGAVDAREGAGDVRAGRSGRPGRSGFGSGGCARKV